MLTCASLGCFATAAPAASWSLCELGAIGYEFIASRFRRSADAVTADVGLWCYDVFGPDACFKIRP